MFGTLSFCKQLVGKATPPCQRPQSDPRRLDVCGRPLRCVVHITRSARYTSGAEQEEHADEMDSMGGMDHGDDDVLVLEPAHDGDLTHTFDEAGQVQIACHQPGHFEAGMVLDVAVD